MKTIFLSLVSCITTIAVVAQTNSTLTVTVRGDQTDQIIIDGRSYVVTQDNNDINGRNMPITVTDLAAGQHTLQIVRTDDYGNKNTSTTYFNLRSGYDLQVAITANGSVQQRETRWETTSNAAYATPMSSADFNVLYNDISSEWRSSTRLTMLNDAFSNTSNYFTTAQAMRLIRLISSQSSRLSLAKAGYRTITDPSNFSQMYSLLNSQAHRDELAAYVNSYNANNANNTGTSSTAMTSTRFNTIYRTAQRQTSTSARLTYLSNIFSTTTNYYSVAQARQLIQLVSGESNRLYLAKISYRGIVDPSNFYRIHELLSSQASKDELTTYVNTYNGGTGTGNTNATTAMTASEFNTLYRDVQNRLGLGAKMSRLTDIFNTSSYYFTVAQAEQLIRLVSSESNRLDLAKLSYNNIVDQYNFSQLYDVLSSQASRNELDEYVRSNSGAQSGTGYNYNKTPMSDASFNALYNDVSSTWGLGAKMSRLTDIFNNESNYFTVVQAKKLVQLVSSESNRLQLAKSSYGNITDPQNFSSMYDVLSSQSSRDELANYVSTYSNNQ